MSFLKWDKSLSVQVKEIDDQHKKLVGIINRAFEESKGGKDCKKCNEILADLIGFSRTHFSTEEKYFKQFNFEGTEEHMKEHADIMLKILNFKKRLDKGEDIAAEALNFLKEWLEDHLATMDQKYVKCFKEHGLE